MRFGSLLTVLLALAAISGCTQLPDLDSQITPEAKAAPYPALIPLDTVLDETADTQSFSHAGLSQELRVAALRARAAQMRATAGQ